jgi:putative ABC transport system substrate-binding protein
VFAGVIDPVAAGIVMSFARSGGNITGITYGIGGAGFGGEWVELLKEAAPDVSHMAGILNSENPVGAQLVQEMQVAARTLKVKLDVLDAGTPAKLDGTSARSAPAVLGVSL